MGKVSEYRTKEKTMILRNLAMCAMILAMASMVLAADAPKTNLAIGSSSPEEILEAAAGYIQWHEEQGLEVPEYVYEFHFKVEQTAHPEYFAGRTELNPLDQHDDACPGTHIEGPDFGDVSITSCGTTMYANNDCSYPNCRNARDVIIEIDMNYDGWLTVRTAGSMFDTYLCLYEDACCGDISDLIDSNNNAPWLNNGQRLAAGLESFISAGTYYLILDGAGPAARGAYCLTLEFTEDGEGGNESR